MTPKNNIRIFPTQEQMAEAAGQFIIETANNAVNTTGRFTISLSGGNTPETLYLLLSKPPFRDEMPWSKTFVFWGDERCVPSGDERNNARMAKASLLDQVALPPSNIYAVPVELSPEDAANSYQNTLIDFFGDDLPRFDLILLGLGENGHTASLFPGSDTLTDNTHLIRATYVQEQKMSRITMTANLINQASNILFLVAGDGKAEILDTVLNAPYQPDTYPAQLIKPANGNLYWFVDNKAAVLLHKK